MTDIRVGAHHRTAPGATSTGDYSACQHIDIGFLNWISLGDIRKRRALGSISHGMAGIAIRISDKHFSLLGYFFGNGVVFARDLADIVFDQGFLVSALLRFIFKRIITRLQAEACQE